jgi:ribonuclease HI
MPKKYYAVASGRSTGVFQTWDECKEQVRMCETHHLPVVRSLKSVDNCTYSLQVYGYSGAKYKSFKTAKEAHDFVQPFRKGTIPVANETVTRIVPPTTASLVVAATSNKRPYVSIASCETKEPQAKQQQHPASLSINGNKKPKDATTKTLPPHHLANISCHIMFDGGARGNPGIAGAGATITIVVENNHICSSGNSRQTIHVRAFVGCNATNNQAEYQGIISGLDVTLDKLQILLAGANENVAIKLVVQGDSKLIIQQLKGEYQVKSEKLKPLFQRTQSLLNQITSLGKCSVVLEHVYRSENKAADGMCLLIDFVRIYRHVCQRPSMVPRAFVVVNFLSYSLPSRNTCRPCQ